MRPHEVTAQAQNSPISVAPVQGVCVTFLVLLCFFLFFFFLETASHCVAHSNPEFTVAQDSFELVAVLLSLLSIGTVGSNVECILF